MAITILTLTFTVLAVSALSIALSYIDRETQRDNNQLRDQIARITKVLADYEQRFATLEINDSEPVDGEKAPTKEEKADFDYNTGMNNIFNYSVSSGIKVGNVDE